MRMTIDEYAAKEGVSRVTVHRWLNDGKLKTELTPSGRTRIIGVNKDLPQYLLHSDNQENIYSKESFIENYKNHVLEILKDDGLYRHIKLSDKNNPIEDIDITTSPGSLIIRSLMGVFAFERIDNMFDFFRDGNLTLNVGYYDEKCINSPSINKENYSKQFVISLYAIVHAINLYDVEVNK